MSSPHVQHASFVYLLCAVTQPIDRTRYPSSPRDDRPPATRHAAKQMPQPRCGPGPTPEAPETATGMVGALSRGTSTLWRAARRHGHAAGAHRDGTHRPPHGLRTAPSTTAAHRSCAPASHPGLAHRAAPRKTPGPPLPHPESSLPRAAPRHRQPGARERFRQAPRPLPPYGDAGSLASDVSAA
jgi:hypothetical protein